MLNRKRRLIERTKRHCYSRRILKNHKRIQSIASQFLAIDWLWQTFSKSCGRCLRCVHEVPSKIAKCHMGNGFVMVELYCNSCFHHIKDDLHTNGLNEKIEVKKRKWRENKRRKGLIECSSADRFLIVLHPQLFVHVLPHLDGQLCGH